MHDRPRLNGAFRRSSSLDSFDSSKRNLGWRLNQGNTFSNSREEKPIISSLERETRAWERLKRLSLSIKSVGQGVTSDDKFPQNKVQVEQILLYINTGAKYNVKIYEKKDEYARMVYELFSLGGHCYDIMMSSFKNIVSNPKVNGVIMTRMDRLLNFLSFIQDLHKNYCDPAVIGIAPKQRLQSGKSINRTQDDLLRSSAYIYNADSKRSNEGEKIIQPNKKLTETLSRKIAQNINLKKSLLERYKIEWKNKNFLSPENPKNTYGHIKQRSLEGIKKNPVYGDQILSREPVGLESYGGNVRKIFESLQYSRKKIGEDKDGSRLLSNIQISKDFISESKSENSLKLEKPNLSFKKSEDQRIQGLQRLIEKLKEVKLGSNSHGDKFVEEPKSSSICLPYFNKEARKVNGEYSNSAFDPLKAESLIQTQAEFLNVLNKNIKSEKCLPEKVNDESNSKESTHKEKRRWELDTPYIYYRNIELDNRLNPENRKEKYNEPVNMDHCGNTEVEQTYIRGIPPVKYEYSKAREPVCVTQHISPESTPNIISQIDQEKIERTIKLEQLTVLNETNEEDQFDDFVTPELVSLCSEKNIGLESAIPKNNSSNTDIQIKTINPALVHVPKNVCIDVTQETFAKDKLCNISNIDSAEDTSADLIGCEDTLVHAIIPDIAFDEIEQTLERRHDLENSPLKPIKILKDGETAVEEISKITNKLEDMTIMNESLIKRIEDLPIENIVSNENSLSILNSYIPSSEKNSNINEKAISMSRISNIEYFTSGDEELRSKIEEYNYWFENASSGNHYELSLDGLNLEEFYYKSIESIPRCYDELIDMSESSIYNLCKIICNTLPRVVIEQVKKDTVNKAGENENDVGIEVLAHYELCEENLLSFVHEQVMKDPSYLEFRSSIRREVYPPDDNFILLIIDLIRELVKEWRYYVLNSQKMQITNELISKQVVDILSNSYEPYLSEVSPEEWVLKKVFHAPRYPNILESEKELLNIEHLFKYHSCEDSITNEYINMDRQQWLQTSNYYLPLLNEVIEQILHETIGSAILDLKTH
ncbi:chloroquine resistance marker protein [Cryptosporidium ubiquitum]|uniref:Chloroquine resistance marker protein n=1 Tax=Cryptosporidium ubiquitum TaxID=857276 RepID=A0A1J4MNI6_9CRYT|nr:chloroquine resistance marker protein [Cryptosporidium ubiquitum]OII74588.1 chloroquine resistance marker protein [Cryptosporidium ubiquitum]